MRTAVLNGANMQTAPKSKNKKLSPKKKPRVENREIDGKIIGEADGAVDTSQMAAADAGVTREERHQLIAVAAYFRAERRNFAPGCELEDWLEAEAEILKMGMDSSQKRA
jgi:hypothetical protein